LSAPAENHPIYRKRATQIMRALYLAAEWNCWHMTLDLCIARKEPKQKALRTAARRVRKVSVYESLPSPGA
jgi:hypothetical protein